MSPRAMGSGLHFWFGWPQGSLCPDDVRDSFPNLFLRDREFFPIVH